MKKDVSQIIPVYKLRVCISSTDAKALQHYWATMLRERHSSDVLCISEVGVSTQKMSRSAVLMDFQMSKDIVLTDESGDTNHDSESD